jgi:hypothetical protein
MYDYRTCFQKKSENTWALVPDGTLPRKAKMKKFKYNHVSEPQEAPKQLHLLAFSDMNEDDQDTDPE